MPVVPQAQHWPLKAGGRGRGRETAWQLPKGCGFASVALRIAQLRSPHEICAFCGGAATLLDVITDVKETACKGAWKGLWKGFLSFEFASGSNLGPSFQIALNSYPVLARRTPQSRSPAQGQETELRRIRASRSR